MTDDYFFMLEKRNKLDNVASFNDGAKLLYQWVKTNHISQRQFTELNRHLISLFIHALNT